jgi:integrase/recombinase XerD
MAHDKHDSGKAKRRDVSKLTSIFDHITPIDYGVEKISLPRRFDPKLATPFVEKSLSEETKSAYHRVITEFFAFVGNLHPTLITVHHIIDWRDSLIRKKRKPATVAFKLSVVRSFFDYLKAGGILQLNPASTKLVPPPQLPEDSSGRALTPKEVYALLAGPNRETTDGARDYAMMLLMLRTSIRVSEVCSFRASSIKWSHGRSIIKFKVKGGRERTLPLPKEVKEAIDSYLRLDDKRRKLCSSDGEEAYLFQPHSNYRTLIFNKPLSRVMVWKIVTRWGEYGGIGKVSPHDLRRTAITKALDQGLSYRQVQMMSGHKDPKTVMKYDLGKQNLDLNAVNFLDYQEEDSKPSS